MVEMLVASVCCSRSHINLRLSVKNALVFMSLAQSALLFASPLVPLLGRWVFAAWLCALFLVFPGIFTVIPVTALRAFGPKYFGSNYGLIVTSYVC